MDGYEPMASTRRLTCGSYCGGPVLYFQGAYRVPRLPDVILKYIPQIGQLVVYSVGRDDRMLFWDGFIESNWIGTKLFGPRYLETYLLLQTDDEMQKREREYSTYRDVKVLICTWNIDSAKPEALTGNRDNTSFLDNVLGSVDRPDIIVFGFQEVIDLENKKLTASV